MASRDPVFPWILLSPYFFTFPCGDPAVGEFRGRPPSALRSIRDRLPPSLVPAGPPIFRRGDGTCCLHSAGLLPHPYLLFQGSPILRPFFILSDLFRFIPSNGMGTFRPKIVEALGLLALFRDNA